MNTLASLLPRVRLERLIFGFSDGVSAQVIRNLTRGLLGNGSLL